MNAADQIFAMLKESSQSGAPLYLQLRKSIEDAVNRGLIGPGDALPSERDIASKADISRVTVRKAVQDLVKGGILVQRHGSGTFVAPRMERVEQSLSRLTSFTEDMARRGMAVRSAWLDRGLYAPSPDEMMVLGLSSSELVARVARLRIANDTPLAIARRSMRHWKHPAIGRCGRCSAFRPPISATATRACSKCRQALPDCISNVFPIWRAAR